MKNQRKLYSLDEIKLIPIPLKTKSYQPISHSYLSNEVKKKLVEKGYSIQSEEYAGFKNGDRMWGRLILNGIGEINPVFIFGNSYDKSLAFTCYSGIISKEDGVMMILSSEYYGKIYRRHTTKAEIQINEKINLICSTVNNDYKLLQLQKEKLNSLTILRKELLELISELYFGDNQILSGDNLKFIKDDFKKKGIDGTIKLWSLYVILLKAISSINNQTFIKKAQSLNKYFVDKFDLPKRIEDETIPESDSSII